MINNDIILETKLVADIKGDFFVPSYQRGYRWGEVEVTRLLDDVYLNGKKNYCLQPVVVRKKNDVYELIKHYLKCVENGDISGQNVADHAKELRKLLGSFGMQRAEVNYYRNLVSYVCLPDEKNAFIYGKKQVLKL